MNNTKFLNKVKEFAKNFNQGYDISKFTLDKPYEQSILLVATIGGSSGGDCWGGHTSDYTKDDYEVQSSLESNLRYAVSELKEYFNVEVDFSKYVSSIGRYNYIDRVTNDHDYYGNHTEQGLYEVSLYPVLKESLPDDLFQVFKSYWSNRKNVITQTFEDEKRTQKIQELELKIESFETNKEKELKQLKSNLEDYKERIKQLEHSLSVFHTKKTTELKDLKSSLDKITNETTEPEKKLKKKM